MARIPDDELERLKREVALADVCRRAVFPAAPGAVILVVVGALAIAEELIAGHRPGEFILQSGHSPHVPSVPSAGL